jgi:type 1 glutamine amidotransferase
MNRLATVALMSLSALLAFTQARPAERDLADLAETFRVESSTPSIGVLVLTATHGFRHGPAIDMTKRVLGALDDTTEFDFTFTEDVDDLNGQTLDGFDLLLLANSTLRVAEPPAGYLDAEAERSRLRLVRQPIPKPVTFSHQAAILAFLSSGGGLAGAHSALDALYGWPEYRRMVGGGLFESHPWTQEVRILVEDAGHPAAVHLGGSLVIRDEIYVLDENPRPNVQVLMSLDTSSVDLDRGPQGRSDFPISWLRAHEDGRVFMTKLGHFPEVWADPAFLEHLLQGMRFAAGRL